MSYNEDPADSVMVACDGRLDDVSSNPGEETEGEVFPSRQRFRTLVQPGVAVPIVRELDVDGLDPLSAFALLSEGASRAVLLETSEAASGDADMSIVVPRAAALLQGSDVLEQVRKVTCDRVADVGTTLPRFIGGVVGMLGHEFATVLEPRVPRASGSHPIATPDSAFLLVDEVVAFDHRAGRVLAVITPRMSEAGHGDADLDAVWNRAVERIDEMERALRRPIPEELTRPLELPTASGDGNEGRVPPVVPTETIDPFAGVSTNIPSEVFETKVLAARDLVRAGECVQLVVSRRFDREFTASPLVAYRAVRDIAPAPYHALLRLGDVTLVGASPEKLVSVIDERIVSHPIAGTRRRGANDEEDLRLEESLVTDPKERAEHMMLVDLGRNDVARASDPGSVLVTRLSVVERYSHVMHLVSRVEGDLRDGLHPVDALAAAFPAGTLTGAPKVRAMELVAELEPDERGAYGGAVGYVGHGRVMDMAITIRTAVVGNGIASVQAGAGIVAASDPKTEEEETRHKARSVLSALAVAERFAGGQEGTRRSDHSDVESPISSSSTARFDESEKRSSQTREIEGANLLIPHLISLSRRNGATGARVLLVDNTCSFTFNVADLLASLGAHVDVVRNDAMTSDELLARGYDAIVLSSGPGHPANAGVSVNLVHAALDQSIPLLGIGLGMHCIGEALGAAVVPLDSVTHGEASPVLHDGRGIFKGAPWELAGGRYHSLILDETTVPKALVVSARGKDGKILAVRHVDAPVEGLQFHPESILTSYGSELLARFLEGVAS